MLRTYGPDCDGRIIDAKTERIPDAAAWIDLEEPTREEEKLVEQCIGVNVPTQAEMAEIEPSSRLYERNGALYMTVSALRGVDEHLPTTTPIGFVLAGNRLVTIRYATPKPIRTFENHARRPTARPCRKCRSGAALSQARSLRRPRQWRERSSRFGGRSSGEA